MWKVHLLNCFFLTQRLVEEHGGIEGFSSEEEDQEQTVNAYQICTGKHEVQVHDIFWWMKVWVSWLLSSLLYHYQHNHQHGLWWILQLFYLYIIIQINYHPQPKCQHSQVTWTSLDPSFLKAACAFEFQHQHSFK